MPIMPQWSDRSHIHMGSNRGMVDSDKEMIDGKCIACFIELLRYLDHHRIHVLRRERVVQIKEEVN